MADQGNTDSIVELGVILCEGKLVEKDFNESQRYLLAAAEQGNTEAFIILASFNENGFGFEIDHKEQLNITKKVLIKDISNVFIISV